MADRIISRNDSAARVYTRASLGSTLAFREAASERSTACAPPSPRLPCQKGSQGLGPGTRRRATAARPEPRRGPAASRRALPADRKTEWSKPAGQVSRLQSLTARLPSALGAGGPGFNSRRRLPLRVRRRRFSCRVLGLLWLWALVAGCLGRIPQLGNGQRCLASEVASAQSCSSLHPPERRLSPVMGIGCLLRLHDLLGDLGTDVSAHWTIVPIGEMRIQMRLW